MKGRRAAVRYSKSLMQLAQEKGAVDAVMADMQLIKQSIDDNRELKNLLVSPLVKAEKKLAVLNAVFSSNINALSAQFIQQVVGQGREGALGIMAEEFISLYNTKNKIAEVKLTTASKIDEATRSSILKMIKEKYQLAEIKLSESVDADLIGGLVLRIGDQQLDASIRRQLKDIENELVQA